MGYLHFGDKPPVVSTTEGRLFFYSLLMFKVGERCYNCADYRGNASYQCNNCITSHRQASQNQMFFASYTTAFKYPQNFFLHILQSHGIIKFTH